MIYLEYASVVLTKHHGLVVKFGNAEDTLVKAGGVVDGIMALNPNMRRARIINALLNCSMEIEKGATLRHFYLSLQPFKEELSDIFDITLDPYIEACRKPYPLLEERRVLLIEKVIEFHRVVDRQYPPEITDFIEQLQHGNPTVHLKSHCNLDKWTSMSMLVHDTEASQWNRYAVPMSFSKVVDAELWLNTMSELQDLNDSYYSKTLPSLFNLRALGVLPKEHLVRNSAMPIETDSFSLRDVVSNIVHEIYYPDGSEEREAALIELLNARMDAYHASKELKDEEVDSIPQNVVAFPSKDLQVEEEVAIEDLEDSGSATQAVKIEVADGFIDQSVYDHINDSVSAREALLGQIAKQVDTRIVGSFSTEKVSMLRKRDTMVPYEEYSRIIPPKK